MKEFFLCIYMTPLRLACKNNNIEIVKLLLKQEGIDVNRRCIFIIILNEVYFGILCSFFIIINIVLKYLINIILFICFSSSSN